MTSNDWFPQPGGHWQRQTARWLLSARRLPTGHYEARVQGDGAESFRYAPLASAEAAMRTADQMAGGRERFEATGYFGFALGRPPCPLLAVRCEHGAEVLLSPRPVSMTGGTLLLANTTDSVPACCAELRQRVAAAGLGGRA